MSVAPPPWGSGRRGFPAAFLDGGSSSFADFLADYAPHLRPVAADRRSAGPVDVPHGTTIVALRFDGGVVMAGDRRSTMGNVIAARDIDKVFVADDTSVIGIAGSAGVAVELVKLFQVELEHFEKIEGTPLSLEGKANRLATMIRGNLGLALQGLAVVPVFAGVETPRLGAPSLSDGSAVPAEGDSPPLPRARIFSYDVAGGCYEERDHHSVGSGSVFARGAAKKLWRPGLDELGAVRVALEVLYDAADDDSATGGPDLGRRIWPTCISVGAGGAHRFADDDLAELVAELIDGRQDNPGGAR